MRLEPRRGREIEDPSGDPAEEALLGWCWVKTPPHAMPHPWKFWPSCVWSLRSWGLRVPVLGFLTKRLGLPGHLGPRVPGERPPAETNSHPPVLQRAREPQPLSCPSHPVVR